MEAIEIRVLGEVGARNAGREVALGGPTQRRLLAVLVAAGPRGLPVDDIVDQLWSPEGRPADPHRSVRTYVNRLRDALNRDAIATRSGGYVLGEASIDDVSELASAFSIASPPALDAPRISPAPR